MDASYIHWKAKDDTSSTGPLMLNTDWLLSYNYMHIPAFYDNLQLSIISYSHINMIMN